MRIKEVLGKEFTHYKNKKTYTILDHCKIQDDSGEWKVALIYTEKGMSEKYVRESVEFFRKFELVGGEN